MTKKKSSRDTGRFLILIPVLLSITVLWSRYGVPSVSADGVTYLQISRNILLGGGLGWQALWASPLHSILIAATSYCTGITDLLVATSLVSPLMCFILVLAVYKLAEDVCDRKTALVASSITAISPHLLFISYSTEPEITYTALLIVSLALFSRAITGNSSGYAAMSGAFFALAYLSRSEGFLIMVLVFVSITTTQGKHFYRSHIFKLCSVATVVFLIAAAPYLSFLHKHYGAFVMSPKASYVITWVQRATTSGHDSLNPDLWGLNGQGRLKWQEPRGIGELFSYMMADPAKSLSVYLKNLSYEIPGRIPYNSGMEEYPQLIPVYLALAAVAALFLDWGALKKEKLVLLLSPLLVFFVLPLFSCGWWKYLIPYFPIVLVLGSKGFTGWAGRLATVVGNDQKQRAEVFIISSIMAAIAISYYVALHPPTRRVAAPFSPTSLRANDATVTKELGTLASKRFGPGRNYMARWSKVIYYLNGFWTAFPVANHADILSYAKKHNVDYIVYEYRSVTEMMNNSEQPGLELVDVIKSDQYVYMLAFYRLAF
jgi:4-amino-4-deoxy-L-arabinose transferase-like glycosyltransferase